jgi:hypothetical protein
MLKEAQIASTKMWEICVLDTFHLEDQNVEKCKKRLLHGSKDNSLTHSLHWA